MTTQTRLGPNLSVHVPRGALRVREFVDGADPSIGETVDLHGGWKNPFEGFVRLTFFADGVETDLPLGDMEFVALSARCLPAPYVVEWNASTHRGRRCCTVSG